MPFTTTIARADPRDHDPPHRAAVARVTLQLAREERDPPALVGQAGQRARSTGVGAACSTACNVPLRWSWRSFAYSAENGSCHTSVTPASISASAPIDDQHDRQRAPHAARRGPGRSGLVVQEDAARRIGRSRMSDMAILAISMSAAAYLLICPLPANATVARSPTQRHGADVGLSVARRAVPPSDRA